MSRKIKINLKKEIDNSYEITIGTGLINNIDEVILDHIKASNYVIISDSNVSPLYSENLKNKFIEKNIKAFLIIFEAGENNKSRKTKEIIEDVMIQNNIGRDSCIIALGGGVTGDLAGFVAATYMRGIPFIQIPTTILSMVDSSIGGKTAVDTPYAKNMIGAFLQPEAVFIDVNTIQTLPDNQKLNGIAEIVKHSIIKDKNYFEYLEKNYDKILKFDHDTLIETIAVSCKIKSAVVEEDEKESGIRKILNFGHTIGHAIEALCDYELSHDICVGIGIHVESLIAHKIGKLTWDEVEKIKKLLLLFKLQIAPPVNISIENIIKKTYSDKKARKNKVEYSLPSSIGSCDFNIQVDENIIKEALEEIKNN